MKNILLVPNPQKDESLAFTREVALFLKDKARVFISEEFRDYNILGAIYILKSCLYEKIDYTVVLGGDGSLLAAVADIGKRDIPVFGINLGHLGFLAEAEKHAAFESLLRLLDKDYQIEKRMMLTAEIGKENGISNTYHALNDVVISRGAFSKLVNISVYLDKEFVDVYKADGIILSTPTGSTAYSLSAGGPIVDPQVDVMIITPICPHKMYSRSIIVPPDKIVKLQLEATQPQRAIVSIDGREGSFLGAGDTLKIKKSEFRTHLIKIKGSGFYSVLRHKLADKDEL